MLIFNRKFGHKLKFKIQILATYSKISKIWSKIHVLVRIRKTFFFEKIKMWPKTKMLAKNPTSGQS